MKGKASRFFGLSASLAGLVVLGWVLTSQAAKPIRHGIPLPTDWSHRHMIFSRTTSPEKLARIEKDPRYWQQVYRREASQRLAVETPAKLSDFILWHRRHSKNLQRDWSISLGTGASAGAGNYPLKYSYDALVARCGTAQTPDYVAYATGLASSTSQASIVAFDNIYSGCGGTVPSTYFAYDTTGTGGVPGIVVTSPVASRGGNQIAFVQTDGSGHGTLVLLKWAPNDGSIGTPTAPANDTPAQYVSCPTLPCMTQFNLTDSGGAQVDDETSSIYYDFSTDTAWVGDAVGLLHQFHPIFLGTSTNPPAEIRNSSWPVTVSLGAFLSSPVYDDGSNTVFVGGGTGFLYAVDGTTGAITKSGQLDHGTGIIEGPIVDSTNGWIYVFASSDGSKNCAFSHPCAAVYQLPIGFAATTTGAEVAIGESAAGTPNPTYLGGFDSGYYNSGTVTGNLYVCGTTGSRPQLFQVPIVAGVPASSGIVASLATTATPCSPVTDVPNPYTAGGPSERIFVSVQDGGFYTACSGGGCVMNFLNTQWLPSTGYIVGQQVLDSNFHIETVISGGTSLGTPPAWPNSTGGTPVPPDGTVIWLDQGPVKTQVVSWAATHSYALNARILDSNNNVEIATTLGTSGSSTPTWNPTGAGSTTIDGTVIWTNAGTVGTFALPAAGGTSGIVSDNVIPSGTLAGASQIYFTTLSDQTCGTSGTGGCAVQASQPALQ